MIILCRKRFHQTSVENCIIILVLLFICKKKEKRIIDDAFFCHAGADEKLRIYFIWPYLLLS